MKSLQSLILSLLFVKQVFKPVFFADFPLFEVRIPSVFDLVIVASGHLSCNVCPFRPVNEIELQDFVILQTSPALLFYIGAQNINIAFTALLVDAIRKRQAYLLPVLCAMEGNLFEQDLVLFRAPGDLFSVLLI